MRLLPFACAFLISGAVSTSAAWSVTAPQDLPAGPGRETTIRLCKSCHPLDKVVGVRRSNKEWIAVVEKMVTQGAEGTTDELNESIDYLTDQYGKPVNVNAATAAELVDALGIDPADAAKIVAYRDGHPKFATWKEVAAVPGIDATWIERRQKNLTFAPSTVYGVSTVTGRPHVVYGR